jgi:16S rRNA G966 N2-methylase RsmD
MEKLYPRWDKATNELISKLEDKKINLINYNTIELFGRDGSWQTQLFANKVKNIEVWEINEEFKEKLKENLPNSKIKIIDSIKTLKEKETFQSFDLILIDNPNNTYGPDGEYCEHFDILKNIIKLFDKKAIIVFNVNRKPFNYFKFPEWKDRREKFYENKNTDEMSIKQLLIFYEKYFEKMGLKTIFSINVIRVLFEEIDTNHYFAFLLTK